MKCCDIVLFNILYFSDDGIVISISIWQCILEFCTNCLVSVCLLVFKEHSYNSLLFLQLISYCLNYMILPSFYLLADSRFRNSLYKKGIFKSIWSALKQTYERNSIEFEMEVMSQNTLQLILVYQFFVEIHLHKYVIELKYVVYLFSYLLIKILTTYLHTYKILFINKYNYRIHVNRWVSKCIKQIKSRCI